jgi:hypothetical protein
VPNQFSQSFIETGEPVETGEPAKSHSQDADQSDGRAQSNGFYPMTDQKQKPRPCENDQRQETIGEHFGSCVTIEEISDGEIDIEEIEKKYKASDFNWDAIEESCQIAMEEKASRPYLGRKTNGDLMADAMAWCKKTLGADMPKFWYPVIKKLRESTPEPVLVKSDGDFPWEPPGATEQDIWDKAIVAGVIRFEDFKNYFFGSGALFNFDDWTC